MIQSLRTLALALALVLIPVVLFLALGGEDDALALPDTWALAIVLVVGLGGNVLIPVVGYQTPAVPPGAPRESHVAALQSAMILRFALAESAALVSIVLAFVVTAGGMLLVLVGCAIALLTMALHVYPSERPIERYRRQLERDGGVSYLREDLGLPPKLGGAIREL